MSFLASVGRAQPSRNMAQVLNTKLNIEQGERRERLVNAQTALSAENLRQLQRKGEFEQQEMDRLMRPVSIDTLAPLVEGGEQGPMFQMMYRMADAQGFVDKSVGGLGTITMRDLGQLQKLMQSPEFASNLSMKRIEYYRGQLNQIKIQMAEKPDDEKLKQAFQQTSMGLNNAIAQNKQLSDYMTTQTKLEMEQEKEAARAQEKQEEFGLLDRKLDMAESQFAEKMKLEREAMRVKSREEGIPKDAEGLRKDFTKESKDFIKVSDAFGRVIASSRVSEEDPEARGAGDLALIFNYMKILDPGSVVRESEFANAETSRAFLEENKVPSWAVRLRDKFFKGARLTPRQRRDFVRRAEMLYDEQEKSHLQLRSEYGRIAKRYNVEPSDVIVNYIIPREDIETAILDPEEEAKKNPDYDEIIKKYPYLAPRTKK